MNDKRMFEFRLMDGSGTGRTIELDIKDYLQPSNEVQTVPGPRGHWPPERIEFEGKTWELVQTTGHRDGRRAYAPVWLDGEPQRVAAVYDRDGEERRVYARAFDAHNVGALRDYFMEHDAKRVEVLPLDTSK